MYLIKVSSNPSLGKGHINRCIRIRNKIKSEVKWFVDKGTKKLFFNNINDEVYEEDNNNSFSKLEQNLTKNYIKAIIIDVASVEKNKIKKLSKSYPVVLIVDYYLKISNTLRICLHPIPRLEKNFLSGFQYLPLYKKKSDSIKKEKIKILVSFGNIDSVGFTEKVIEIIIGLFSSKVLDSEKIQVNVVLGQYKKKVNLIKKKISLNKKFKIFLNLANLDDLYKKASFAIGAPGFSQLERIEYGIPTILLPQNPVQENLLKYWEESKCCLVAKNIDNDLKAKILLLVKSKEMINKLKKNINKKFDNKGASRIIKKIENYCKAY